MTNVVRYFAKGRKLLCNIATVLQERTFLRETTIVLREIANIL